jgi:hypothetical protein
MRYLSRHRANCFARTRWCRTNTTMVSNLFVAGMLDATRLFSGAQVFAFDLISGASAVSKLSAQALTVPLIRAESCRHRMVIQLEAPERV